MPPPMSSTDVPTWTSAAGVSREVPSRTRRRTGSQKDVRHAGCYPFCSSVAARGEQQHERRHGGDGGPQGAHGVPTGGRRCRAGWRMALRSRKRSFHQDSPFKVRSCSSTGISARAETHRSMNAAGNHGRHQDGGHVGSAAPADTRCPWRTHEQGNDRRRCRASSSEKVRHLVAGDGVEPGGGLVQHERARRPAFHQDSLTFFFEAELRVAPGARTGLHSQWLPAR